MVKIAITGAMDVRGGLPDCQTCKRTSVVCRGKEQPVLLAAGSDHPFVESSFFWLGADCIIVSHEEEAEWDSSVKVERYQDVPIVHAFVRAGEWDWPGLQLPKVVDPATREVLEGESLLAHAVEKAVSWISQQHK